MAAVTSIVRAQQIVLQRIDTVLRPLDLTFARYEILTLLSFTKHGSLPMTRMGALLQVHPTSVTSAVDRLEGQGFVERLPHPTDRRAVLASITEAGRARALAATDRPQRPGLRAARASPSTRSTSCARCCARCAPTPATSRLRVPTPGASVQRRTGRVRMSHHTQRTHVSSQERTHYESSGCRRLRRHGCRYRRDRRQGRLRRHRRRRLPRGARERAEADGHVARQGGGEGQAVGAAPTRSWRGSAGRRTSRRSPTGSSSPRRSARPSRTRSRSSTSSTPSWPPTRSSRPTPPPSRSPRSPRPASTPSACSARTTSTPFP